MRLLLVHRSYPGQFRWIIPQLRRLGFEITFVCKEKTNWDTNGINIIESDTDSKTVNNDNLSTIGYEFAEAVSRTGIQLKKIGWEPDVILSHYGWGVWRISDIFPKAKLILYCEWWYKNSNIGFNRIDYKEKDELDVMTSLTNQALCAAINRADQCIVPTQWQLKSFPEKLHGKFQIIEDGFPLDIFTPRIGLNKDYKLPLKLIYVSRGLEYTRGIDRLHELIGKLGAVNNKLSITVIADNRRIYDDEITRKKIKESIEFISNEAEGITYKSQLAYNSYIEELEKADFHLYLSREFVLSWSFIESSLLGSRIFSMENISTIEKTHSNHINFININEMVKTLEHYLTEERLKEVRLSKLNWLNTEEGISYRQRHSVSAQINKISKLILEV